MELENVIEKKVDKHLDRFVDKKVGDRISSLKGLGKLIDEEDDDVELHEGDADFEDAPTELDKTNLAKLSPDEATKLINKEDVTDIFIDIGEKYFERGEVVSYTIIDNPTKAQLGTEYHPFSYDELKAKYGGGHFKVIARHKGKYIRTDVKYLAGPKKDFNAKEEKASVQAVTSPAIDMELIINKLTETSEKNAMALMKTQEEARKREMELQREIRETQAKTESTNNAMLERVLLAQQNQKNSSVELLTALAPILAPILPKLLAPKEVKNDSIEVMMKVQEMNMKMMEKMNESNQKIFETLQKQIEKIADGKSNKNNDSGMSPFEVMKMVKEAESEGFEKMRMIRELAKEEADERASMRGDRDSDDEPSKKGSAVDTLISTLTPMLATKMLGGGGATPTFNNPAPQIARNPQVVPSRSSLSKTSVEPVKRTTVNATGTVRTEVQANPARKETRTNQKSETGSGFGSINPVRPPSVLDTLKTLPEPEVKVSAPIISIEAENPKISVVETPKEVIVSPEERQANVEYIKGIVFPIVISNSMNENATIQNISDLCIVDLENCGLELSVIVRDFDDVAISAIISELPEVYHEMIKDLHHEIIQKLKNRIGQNN